MGWDGVTWIDWQLMNIDRPLIAVYLDSKQGVPPATWGGFSTQRREDRTQDHT